MKPVGSVVVHALHLDTTTIRIKEYRYALKFPIQFIQLHSNETTAAEVTESVVESLGINFLQLRNAEQRLIELSLDGSSYRFDPNRIFSNEGITASLQLHSQFSDKAFTIVSQFRDSLLKLLDTNKTIISVHNNTDGAFSLVTYQQNKTGLVFQNPSHDPDDFFITTDSIFFEKIKSLGFNVVLEYSNRLADDGSLSIYCSRNGIKYINVEAEHGHKKEQAAMLQAAIEILK